MLLDRQQLCEALGVSDSAISAWEKKGMPVVRKGRGRGQKSLYNFDAVSAWCKRTGAGLGVQAILARLRRAEESAAAEGSAGFDDRLLAIALQRARVDAIKDIASWDFQAPPRELVDFL